MLGHLVACAAGALQAGVDEVILSWSSLHAQLVVLRASSWMQLRCALWIHLLRSRFSDAVLVRGHLRRFLQISGRLLWLSAASTVLSGWFYTDAVDCSVSVGCLGMISLTPMRQCNAKQENRADTGDMAGILHRKCREWIT